ncbi:MAG: OmpA family protein [Planctomycetes bacterium]|nr:OmpA family protein [Planctomycetota bacterium]
MKKLLVLSIAAVLPFLGGCVSTNEYDRLLKTHDTSEDANAALSAENERLEDANGKLSKENAALRKSLADMKEVKAPTVDQEALLAEMKKIWSSENGDWDVVSRGGAVGVRIDDKGVLFKPGSWEITDKTKEILGKLADLLKSKMDANSMVRVDGHTDSDPVKRLKSQGIADNVHLSIMRAQSVRNFLVSKGIESDRIFVAGFGEYWPIESNANSAGKQRNRRVEVYMGTADGLSIGEAAHSENVGAKEAPKATVEKTSK